TDVGKLGARVEAPNQLAALSVKGDDGERGSGGVQDAADDDRRGLDFGRAAPRSVCGHVTGVVDPRHAQLRDVGPVDLIECGVPRVTRVAARDAPVTVRSLACASGGGGGGKQQKGDGPHLRVLPEIDRLLYPFRM